MPERRTPLYDVHVRLLDASGTLVSQEGARFFQEFRRQTGDEGFVSRLVPDGFTKLACGDRLREGVSPILAENIRIDPGEEPCRQVEAQHQELQRLGSQQRECLT